MGVGELQSVSDRRCSSFKMGFCEETLAALGLVAKDGRAATLAGLGIGLRCPWPAGRVRARLATCTQPQAPASMRAASCSPARWPASFRAYMREVSQADSLFPHFTHRTSQQNTFLTFCPLVLVSH